MKHTLNTVAVAAGLLLCPPLLSAQSVDDMRTNRQIVSWSQDELPNYSIQIAATKNPPADASQFSKADVVYEFRTADGFIKYYYGRYQSYAEANRYIGQVRAMGFEGAFIVNMKKAAQGTSSLGDPGVTTVGHKPIEIDPGKDYVIQVGAFRYPLYVSTFEDIGRVYEYRLSDKIFRYTTPPLRGSEVEAELKRIKGLGYVSAFVVEYATYSPYKIE